MFYANRGYNVCGKQKNSGIVYNEMKDIYVNIISFIKHKSQFSLFQNSCYGFDYGGEPDYIMNLEYDTAKIFYRKYYTPSNSYLHFYGDIDIEEKLTWIYEYCGKAKEYSMPKSAKVE